MIGEVVMNDGAGEINASDALAVEENILGGGSSGRAAFRKRIAASSVPIEL